VLICSERRVLLAGCWFVLREKHGWLVADKPCEWGVSSPPCRTQAGCVCWTGQDRDGSRVCVWELDPVQLIYLLVVVFRRGEQRWAFAGSCANNADHGVRRQLCCTLCTRCRYLYCSPMSILFFFLPSFSCYVNRNTHESCVICLRQKLAVSSSPKARTSSSVADLQGHPERCLKHSD
jgi:hypothetical protein